MKHLIVGLLISLIYGCGGGGQSSEVSEPSPAPVVIDNPDEQGIKALTISQEFDFRTNVTVNVDVAPNLVFERAFLNICKADKNMINSENCFLRSPLTKAGLKTQFMLPHREQEVVAQIWYYQIGTDPIIYHWQYNPELVDQVFELN